MDQHCIETGPKEALTSVAQLVGCCLAKQKVKITNLIPGQGAGSILVGVSWLGHVQEAADG